MPEERRALGDAIENLLRAIQWPIQSGGQTVTELPAVHWEAESDSFVADVAARALRRAISEWQAMARYVSAAAAIGSDYASAFSAVQADPARAAKTRKADAMARRPRTLRDDGVSAPAIGMRMAREDGRPDRPYDASQVRRWLRRPVETELD